MMNHRVALLCLGTLALFWQVTSFEFLSLDDPFLENNPHFQELSIDNLGSIWFESQGALYAPFTHTLWTLTNTFSKTERNQKTTGLGLAPYPDQRFHPFPYHLISVILHILACILVYGILRQLKLNEHSSFLGALVFSIHPLQVEAVSWISLQKDLLAGLFCFASILLFLRADELSQHKEERRPTALYASAFVCFLLGVCSKVSAVVTPILILILMIGARRRSWRETISPLTPWILVIAIGSVIAWKLQLQDAAIRSEVSSLFVRPLIALDAIAFYLWKVFLPLNLTFDYGRSPEFLLNTKQVYFTWILPLGIGLLLLAFRFLRLRGWLPYALFIAALLPTLGLKTFAFQKFSTTADHYLYIAFLGPAILAGAWIQELSLKRKTFARASLLVIFIALFSLGVRNFIQQKTWKDSASLYSYAIQVNPKSWFSYHLIGGRYYLRGEYDTAYPYFQRSSAINGNTYGLSTLARLYYQKGDLKKTSELVEETLRINPRDRIAQSIKNRLQSR